MGEPSLAEVIDIRTRRAVAQVSPVMSDDRGNFVMIDGARIPVRNGGPIGDPLEDWQTAREVEQAIVAGDGIDARPLGLRNVFGAALGMSTSLSGWTTYRVVGTPGGVLWGASTVAVYAPASIWAALHGLGATLALAGAYGVWSWFCARLAR